MTGFYGLLPSEIADVGRALWQSWRHVGPSFMRDHGGKPVPAIVAVEQASFDICMWGGEGTRPETVRFVREHSSWHCLDVARAAGYFAGDSVGL